MLYIRADGNSEIGTGHIMRCLSVAFAIKAAGDDCTFITADNQMEALIQDRGFSVICLDSVWNDLNVEVGKMKALISEKRITRLLVDTYFVTPEYLNALCKLTNVAYIDDINAFLYPCHMLINYNIYADQFDYPARYRDTRLLLGCRYAPLREEFKNIGPCRPHSEVKSLLITTGGSDNYHISVTLAEACIQNPVLKGLKLHFISGRFNQSLGELKRLAEKHSGIIIHENVREMSKLMLACDAAISAGGSTLYELCACGLPTVLLTLADNQLDAAKAFGDGIMLYSGDVRHGVDNCVSNLSSNLSRLIAEPELRGSMAIRMRALVDGEGASRIADALLNG